MPTQTQHKILLSVYGIAPTPASIQALAFQKRERLLRAFKFGGGTWGLAILCIFIPVLHFILVPTGLVVGPIVFFKFLKQKDLILSGNGICPKCKSLLSIPKQEFQFPIQEICVSCNTLVVGSETKE